MASASPAQASGSPRPGSSFVTGDCQARVYEDEATVAEVTDWLMGKGCTVFQLWLLDPDERTHSLEVLRRVNVPSCARVLSLGSGVGGMERYWAEARPDIRLTLVNASRAQQDRCVAPGERLCFDMRAVDVVEGMRAAYDLVVMAYSLHHVSDVPAMLYAARACLKPGGTLLVLDVVDGSERFNALQRYRSPSSMELQHGGLVRLDYGLTWHRLPHTVIGEHAAAVINIDAARPTMWVGLA